ncbi:MAG: TetR/AcrR family transcriptional regulator [Myxococcota bacterium]
MGDASETRAALVKAAFQVIAQQGFEGLRTRAVADAVGVNVATLHYHFPSKEDLVGAVLDELVARFKEEAPVSDLPPEATPADVLEAHFAAVKHWARQAPDVQLVWHEFWLRSMRDPALRDRVREVMTRHRRALARLLNGEAGEGLRPALGPQTASALAALLSGLTMYALVDPTTDEADSIYRHLVPLLTTSPQPASAPRARKNHPPPARRAP